MAFEYQSLQPGEIRLLKICSGCIKCLRDGSARVGSDTIHCTLHHISLEDSAKYHYNALSYTWGDQSDRREIFIGSDQSRRLQICANLGAALEVFCRHLREPRKYADTKLNDNGFFWIDAICINQADKQERSQQVMLMRTIYQRAARLLIWLGDEYDGSKQAMRMVFVIAKKAILDPLGLPEFLDGYIRTISDARAWPSLVSLIGRPWPRRTWVMQEYASSYSNSTVLYCGNEAVTSDIWDAFLRVWDGSQPHLDRFKLSITENFSRVLNESFDIPHKGVVAPLLSEDKLEKLQQIWLEGMGDWYNLELVKMDAEENQRSLLTWVRSARSTVASDPRDKIYACFGFLRQHVLEGLNSSSDCDLDILINDYDAPVHEIYASFVKAVVSASKKLNILSDCFRRSHLVHSTWIPDWTESENICILGSEFQRTPKKWHAASNTSAVTSFTDDSRILTIRGARVQNLRQRFRWDSNSSDKVQQLINFLCTCKEALLVRGETENSALEILWEAFIVFFQIERSSEDQGEKQFRLWMFQNLALGGRESVPGMQWIEPGQELLNRTIDETGYFGLTDGNCVGRFPSHSKEADLICVILGSDTPIVLRPVDNHFELIGACYVDGLMYGEGLRGVDESALHLEDFEIH